MKRLLTIVFACFLTHQTIEAAEISIVSPETPEHPAIIMIKGMLMNEDYHFHEDVTLFSNVADRQKNAIVFLEGPGGKLRTALEIGLAINQRGFSTAVADGAMCNSSCALVWLGGKERFMGKDAIIGFHAASGIPAKPGESPKISSVGNAMAGAYMAQVGIKDLLTVAFLTRAPPEAMERLDLSKAVSFHIPAKAFSFSQDEWSWANQAFHAKTAPADAATTATAVGTTGRVIQWRFPSERFPIERLTTLPPPPKD
jgi:hypothetical protein